MDKMYLFYTDTDFDFTQVLDGISYITPFQKGQLIATHGPVIEGVDSRPQAYKEYPYKIVDKSTIPLQRDDLAEQLYVEDDVLYKDSNWDKLLMPTALIKSKHIERLSSELDGLIDGPTPDMLEIAKKQREIERLKAKDAYVVVTGRSYPDPDWYPIAIAGLDARVAKGESDKPMIRQKLQAKLAGPTPDMEPKEREV